MKAIIQGSLSRSDVRLSARSKDKPESQYRYRLSAALSAALTQLLRPLVWMLMAWALVTTGSAYATWEPIESGRDGVALNKGRSAKIPRQDLYRSTVRIFNRSDETLEGVFRILVERSTLPAKDPDGYNEQGLAYFNLDIDVIPPRTPIRVPLTFELARKPLHYKLVLQRQEPGSNLATYAEAEGGGAAVLNYLGSDFLLTDGDPAFVSILETATDAPEDDSRVGELDILFPAAGTYEMYARVRVGPEGANDDSFYAPDGFGSANGWILVNNISGYIAPGEPGYTPEELVVGGGSAATEVWKWMRFVDTTYEVPEGQLNQIFRYAGREDGLDIDKFAFAREGVVFTIEQLEDGLPGEVIPPPPPFVPEGPPLATGYDKFLGGVCCGRQRPNFEAYWNQVTPENAGKWGSVEGTRDVFNWTELDEAYDLAKENGFMFKHHVLVWGNQQPAWIRDLPAAEQLEEILEWFNAVNDRYAAIDWIEVVNEFDNDPPDSANDGPGYIDALRLFDPATTTDLLDQFTGDGLTAEEAAAKAAEYDWIINAFQMARDIFPASTQLMINEYSVVNTGSRADKMIEIANLLQDRGLIDAIGFQGHAFSTTGPNETMQENMDRMAAQTGLDLYVTELDIDGPTDLIQLLDYQRLFPLFWEHPDVRGITMWGYLPGHWRENQGAILAYENGAEKPALVWLRSYMRGMAPKIVDPGLQEVDESTGTGELVVDLASTTYDDLPHAPGDVTWMLLDSTAGDAFSLNSETGEVTVSGSLSPALHTLYVQVQEGEYTSNVLQLQILIPGDLEPTVIVYDFVSDAEGWRGDYGTPGTVAHDPVAEAAVLIPDWVEGDNEQEFIDEIALTDFTDATLEYTFTVSQELVDGGLTVQAYIQTGAPDYARIYGSVEAVTAGSNTITFNPVGDGAGNIEIIERVGFQLNGPISNGSTDNVLLENVTITLPVTVPPPSALEYDFVDSEQGLRGDYGSEATVSHDAVAEAAVLLPNGTSSTHNYILEIGATDFTGTSLEYTVSVTADQVASGMTVQAYIQTGDPDYARIYGGLESLTAGSNQFVFMPVDSGDGSIQNIQRIAFQINGEFSGSGDDVVLLENITVSFP